MRVEKLGVKMIKNALLFLLCSLCFGECALIQNSGKDVLSADLSENRIVYFNEKSLFVKSIDGKTLFNLESQSDEISAAKFVSDSVIIGFESGVVSKLGANKNITNLLEPIKTKLAEKIVSVNSTQKRAIFLTQNHVVIYDPINNIYKIKPLKLSSKIIDAKINKNLLFIACFDRSLNSLDLENFEQKFVLKAPNLITKIDFLASVPILALIDGNVFYENKSYKISNSKISAMKIAKDKIYFGDSLSNLIVADLNLTAMKSNKLASDEIKELFISGDKLVAVLFNAQIFTCDINGI